MKKRSEPATRAEKSLYINTRRMRFHIKQSICKSMFTGFAISRDGARVASGRPDGCVVLLNATSGEEMHAMKTKHTDFVNTVCFSNDGMYVASGGHDGHVIISECLTGKEVNNFAARERVGAVAFSDDGKYVAYSYIYSDDSPRDTIVVHTVQKPQGSAQLEPLKLQGGHSGRALTSVAFSGAPIHASARRVSSPTSAHSDASLSCSSVLIAPHSQPE